MPIQLLTARDQ